MQGQLFSQNFLMFGIQETSPWKELGLNEVTRFEDALRAILERFNDKTSLSEAETESEIINKVLKLLGWENDILPQVNLSSKGREDVPDMLLFSSDQHKEQALAEREPWRRYRHGIAILEAKRWMRPLDRGADRADSTAPSSQMLRYLSRAEVASDRAVKWGILTNGVVWRLYWQDARSRAEEFFEINLASALGLPGAQIDPDYRGSDIGIKLFILLFRRAAFLPQEWDSEGRNFHAYARNEAREYEELVAQELGQRVFNDVFAQLAEALARGDQEHTRQHDISFGQFLGQQPGDYLDEVRDAALVLLYRLLFLFYAEDRRLLPVHDKRYATYSARSIREDVRDRNDRGTAWSSTMSSLWIRLKGCCSLIDEGDDNIGMPAYNGGLFNRKRSLLLERVTIPDTALAPIIDTLSRRTEDIFKGWINYRDLSVAHLGSIYERLLEYKLVREIHTDDTGQLHSGAIVAQPASFARKVSGSYYTHDELVRLVLRESVGLLAREKQEAFNACLDKLASKRTVNPGDWDALDTQDPASQMLELKICDPAMGSGHFLVALVDDLADRVLEAIAEAAQHVNVQPWAAHQINAGRPWQSPVLRSIAAIRQGIKANAQKHGWAVTDVQLDDRHIVRRMILKKVVFGVDKNPMAVELAKTALWLHTFTVGAPLSFLDHHLKCGDSLHGEKLDTVQRNLSELGALFQQSDLQRLQEAAEKLGQVAELTDADIAEVRRSAQLAADAQTQAAPIHAVLDFWRALRWLIPGWPVGGHSQLRRLFKLPARDVELEAALRENDVPEYRALRYLLNPHINLAATLQQDKAERTRSAPTSRDIQAAHDLIGEANALAQRETFFHWWTSFPTVFSAEGGGFDAVIGNPPWDRIKLQQVEWFAERDPAIATQPRAADRKRMIEQLEQKRAPLWMDYQAAVGHAEANARVLGNGKFGSGDYPLLGGGDVNLYSLFVERAQSLIHENGIVALLTPSGIAADKSAAPFFKSIATTKRLGALFDFENKRVFFPDVDSRFKFCALVFGGPQRTFEKTRCAFFLHSLHELDKQIKRGEVLELSAEDFACVNPNTGAAPIFRNSRDASITMQLYRHHPVLVKHGEDNDKTGTQPDVKVWPVKYVTMFHMTNDSGLFLKAEELRKRGWKRAPLNRWGGPRGKEAVPLYEGKMVQMFDHRAADVIVNTNNLKRAAQQEAIETTEKNNPDRYPVPQYWVNAADARETWPGQWSIAYKSITAPSNMRTMISAIVPYCGVGNSMAMLLPEQEPENNYARWASLLVANMNSLAFDFVLRQKVQGQNLNWFILEQLPVIAAARFDEPLPAAFTAAMRAAQLMNGHHQPTVADFVLPQVLALSYTAHDLASFAHDLGYVDKAGNVLPPIPWNDEERRARMAALDALFFYLYGLNAQDAAYVLGTFPIVRAQDERAFGHYRTQEDVLKLLPLLAA